MWMLAIKVFITILTINIDGLANTYSTYCTVL